MQLYAANPHYVTLKDKPIIVVGSGEHYGALLNRAFDYVPYLDTLAQDGLNHLRLFSGVYRELPGEFAIVNNTLAPQPEHFLCPWRQTADGRFDLDRW